MTAAPNRRLPPVPAEGCNIYLRPIGLSAGKSEDSDLKAEVARALAAGPFRFKDCEILLRGTAGTDRHVLSIRDVVAWSKQLGTRLRQQVEARLELLTAPRQRPGGGRLVRPLLMGVVNVTPDSFSDGGNHCRPEAAVEHGKRLAEAGADILDIGGESARPGAEPIEPSLEARRVLPVLRGLAGQTTATLSIDTRNAGVMDLARDAGATMINDVTALTGDPQSLPTAAGSNAWIVLMHMQGEPRTMNLDPIYDDPVLDIFDYLEARIEACLAAGIPRERIIVDPGIGFGKRGGHNLAILRALPLFHGLGCPVLVGLSRKGLTGAQDRAHAPRDRLPGSLAAGLHALNQGVQILRVHDVAETRQALDIWQRIVGVTA